MASKKTGEKKPPGVSRGKRGMFLRLPFEIYGKLQRMAAAPLPTGKPGTMQGTVISLIEQAREKRAG